MSVDPLADKYPNVTPYLYCNANPVMLVDPDGREVTITGDDGVTVTYLPGTKYEGNDAFVKDMWGKLDEMHTTRSGAMVLDEMVADKGGAFKITNQTAESNGLKVKSYSNKTRLFKMGGDQMSVDAFAHEMFHGYQGLYGYGGNSCANDVEAYLFQALVASEYGSKTDMVLSPVQMLPPQLGAIDNSSKYANGMFNLMLNGNLSSGLLNDLANGFKCCSYAGSMGIANKYTTFSQNQQYRILEFWHK